MDCPSCGADATVCTADYEGRILIARCRTCGAEVDRQHPRDEAAETMRWRACPESPDGHHHDVETDSSTSVVVRCRYCGREEAASMAGPQIGPWDY